MAWKCFPFLLCQVSGLSHWCVHPGEGGSEEQSQWSQCPPGLWTACLVLLSWGQQWAGQSKDGCDSLRQLLLAQPCSCREGGTELFPPAPCQGGGSRGQGAPRVCVVCAQLGHEWPQPGSCPHWVKGQLSRGGLHLRKLLPFCRGGS